jgi:hypothetical protein
MRRLLLVVTCVALSLSACQQGGLPKEKLDWCRAHGWQIVDTPEFAARSLKTDDPGWAADGSGTTYNAVCETVYNENH